MKHSYRFDNKRFNNEELRLYINSNKKLSLLYNNLQKTLTEKYKHVIYSSSTNCAKIAANEHRERNE